MRILCLIDSLGPGGAQRQLVELGKGFYEKGHEVEFLTYHNIDFFKPDLDKYDIPVKTIIEPNYIKRVIKIRNSIRQTSPDAVLSFLEAANFMATIAGFPRRKWKLVVGERSANPAILRSIKMRLYRFFHIFADTIVANSSSNLTLVKMANPLLTKRKMKVIYNIVSVPDLKNSDSKDKEHTKTRILVAASYRPVKNLDGVIDALNSLSEMYKSKIIIEWYGKVIDRAYYQYCEIKIQKYNLGEVLRLHSETKNIHDKYNDADFVGLFSHHEGFPNSICEGMAMGKPVVVAKVSDILKFMKEGENGFLCESKNILSIKSAIIEAINTLREERIRMGENNELVAVQNFNREKIINQYLDLFQN